MNTHELVSLRVNKRGGIEVWVLASVTKDGASYRLAGSVAPKLVEKAARKAAA